MTKSRRALFRWRKLKIWRNEDANKENETIESNENIDESDEKSNEKQAKEKTKTKKLFMMKVVVVNNLIY